MLSADELFLEMLGTLGSYTRTVQDPKSPTNHETVEAEVGRSFKLEDCSDNVVRCRPVDYRWAVANVLHFFACTESAGVLRKYNRHADRFLDGNRLDGAYGPIAVPQVVRCLELLSKQPDTRRAIVSMGPLETESVNKPSCWSFLHFLKQGQSLHLVTYQRSLNLFGVMPYDCILLTNILYYAASTLGLPMGTLYWTIGSLHTAAEKLETVEGPKSRSMLLPIEILSDPNECYKILEKDRLERVL